MKTANVLLNEIIDRGHIDIVDSVGKRITTRYVRYCSEYAEQGYGLKEDQKGILFSDWNDVSRWDEALRKFVRLDNTMPRIAAIAEHYGYEIEWEDEWTECSGCNGAVRTKEDSYSWIPSYLTTSDGIYCLKCVQSNRSLREDILSEFEGSQSPITLDLNLTEAGYYQINDESFENGLYGGQNDDPRVIAKTLKDAGVTRFIFTIDSKGQFDMDFSVHVHEEEVEQAKAALAKGSTKGVDPAEMMKKALQSAPVQFDKGDGITVTKLNLENGTAETTVVSQQDFIEGRAFKK